MTESEFLAEQANQAKQALSKALHDMADAVVEGVDPRAWAQEYPLASMGAAVAAGFLMASAVTPARDQSIRDRLASLFPEQPVEPEPAPSQPAEKSKKPSTIWSMAKPIVQMVQPALVSALHAAIHAKVEQGTSSSSAGYAPAAVQDPTAPLET